ncbi:MAG TPA: siphovirus Gp157 family protein [Candidatus Angelobacter sp.]|nr:siphovirus Gp157 family protein [Candidatus Angelobacter sp.]
MATVEVMREVKEPKPAKPEKKGFRLYHIPSEVERFERKLEMGYGELTPELELEFSTFVRKSKAKLQGAVFALKRMKSNEKEIKEEIDRLAKRKASLENNRERLSGLALYALRSFGGAVKTALMSIYIGRTGKQIEIEAKEGTDLAELAKTHPDFVRVTYSLNLMAIKAGVQARVCDCSCHDDRSTAVCDICKERGHGHEINPSEAALPESLIVRHKPGTESLQYR